MYEDKIIISFDAKEFDNVSAVFKYINKDYIDNCGFNTEYFKVEFSCNSKSIETRLIGSNKIDSVDSDISVFIEIYDIHMNDKYLIKDIYHTKSYIENDLYELFNITNLKVEIEIKV